MYRMKVSQKKIVSIIWRKKRKVTGLWLAKHTGVNDSDSVLADVPVRQPRRLFISIVNMYVHRIKMSHNYLK